MKGVVSENVVKASLLTPPAVRPAGVSKLPRVDTVTNSVEKEEENREDSRERERGQEVSQFL